ncbi:MAG: cytochrome c peroxidase [Myxococcota bacterium]
MRTPGRPARPGWAAAALLGLGACDGAGPAASGWPAPNGTLPSASAAVEKQAKLGRLLFYDPILSADEQTACATCHSELWGMGDGLPTSIGVGGGRLTGPSRSGPNVLARNAPTLWNVAFRGELFWDGREPSLEAQVLLPMHAADELARDPADAVAAIRQIPEYVTLFETAFPGAGDAVTVPHLQQAIAAFERTLISDDALWDAWRDGDARALTSGAQRGLQVFEDAGCDGCHVPPSFESDVYAVRVAGSDVGRFAVTGAEADRGAFRTPTLRNIRESGPYFHDGRAATLEGAIASELASDGVALTADDEAALLEFIGRALVDRSREPYRPKSVPSGLAVPEDGFRIPR